MKRHNILIGIVTGFLVLVASACSDDIPDRDPSFVPNPNAAQVYFANDEGAIIEVLPVDNSVSVTISREVTDGALTVALEMLDLSGVFTYPSSITFPAGEAHVSFEVGFSELEAYEEYRLFMEIDEMHTNPYLEMEGTPDFVLTVIQSDWVDYATGTYYSMYLDNEWVQVLQYSEILDAYRFPSLYADGFHFGFTWAGGAEIVPAGNLNSNGYHVLSSGYVDAEAGLITTMTDPSTTYTYYDEENNRFVFDRLFSGSVSGSLGWQTDSYTITEIL